MKPMKYAQLVIILLGAGSANLVAQVTHTAVSVSYADVNAVINGGRDSAGNVWSALNNGDTCIIPAGKATWTTCLSITKGITLLGATIVTGDHTTVNGMAVTDKTIIIDHITRSNGNAPIIFFNNINSSQSVRISGLTFLGGTVTAAAESGSIVVHGTNSNCQNLRIDHCNFHNLYSAKTISITGWIYGVIDHNIFDCINSYEAGEIVHSLYGGGSNIDGDGSWADGPNWGSNKFVFIEDNTFNNNNPGSAPTCTWDAVPGGRYVERYNVLNGTILSSGHGEEIGYTSMRAIEEYGNIIYPTAATNGGNWGGLLRGGTVLSYNNTWGTTNDGLVGNKAIEVFRLWAGMNPFGGASGANVWDVNDTEGNGTYVPGHSPHLYASGTVTTGGPLALTDSKANWTPNRWVGYSVLDTTNNLTCAVLSNTATDITCAASSGYTDFKSNIGDTYQIHRVLVPLVGVGRGKGDLLARRNGDNLQPYNTTTGTAAWPHNQLEPCYVWDSYKGNPVRMHPGTGQGQTALENRDYYNFNATWTPGKPLTTGVAVGALANRPTQCTPGTDITGVTSNPPGVAYWATDTGPANQNGAVSGTLYVCTATNTWTQYYQPYVYPHPVVSGAPSAPAAPKNLHVVP
jgi:hypothetical protein